MADLSSAISHLLKAKRITAPSQSYAKDNPVESTKVFAYLNGGVRPSGVSSEMGLGLVEAEDVRRAPAPPDPGTSPPCPEIDPNALCLPRANKDFGVPYGGADASPKFQAMINALPAGSAVAVEAENFYLGSTIELSGKAALRIVGLGGQNKNDGGYWKTARFHAMNPNMTMFHDSPPQINHEGTTFQWINLLSNQPGVRGWHINNVNSWRIDYCSAFGNFDRAAIYTGDLNQPAEDLAYFEIREFNAALNSGKAIHILYGGGKITGGYFDAGIVLERCGHVFCIGGQSNHAGPIFQISGGFNTIDWMCEQYSSDTNPAWACEVTRNPNWPEAPWSGQNNIIRSRFTDHPWGTGNMVHLGPGTGYNVVDSMFIGGKVKVKDEGSGNIIR